ncbi:MULTISPECIES: ferrochelatase [Sphingobium]|jgi:protoporphyrin/coproporphyrin ferrochelatase|uniref:ferrochelatase n=1 Tax=Sphingobium TaxID=165695 RepID=UPI000C54AD27|nr:MULTISPECIES: ferrochelatase [Sphingobium]MBA37296.1 ferrochelatase [Sphingobium sp.]MBS90525.1 ferrochelatase [Sphingobium sp.]MCC4258297.1 ferrochelatase [Sphingobium lactosutens]MEE2740350.1 ferrochelatase [Pseudomonadota bacterium]|tara:strand:+ start:3333 stop:4334 length:1002 start_codon:yes stop_codon:yes gene_type:complete
MTPPADHPVIPAPMVGVLLINLGTPDAPDPVSVRRYLAEFLSDRRVVEIPPLLWQPILRGAILTTRPKKSAHAYQQVWMTEGSPLAVYTRATAQALQDAMGGGVLVDWAMRYGNPAIGERLKAMKQAGCDRILLAPLYPQYSGATTATANDAAFAALAKMRWQPAVRTLPPYHDDPAYIGALRRSIEGAITALSFRPDALLASFHGMPERTLKLGDPYHCHSVKTARLLGEALSIPVHMSFQSRFGRAKWLEPETEATLAKLVREGVRNIAVATPGFSADCLETLEEIAMRAKEAFLAAGGENFAYLPCLNASAEAITLYQRLIGRELSGWMD